VSEECVGASVERMCVCVCGVGDEFVGEPREARGAAGGGDSEAICV